MPNSNELRQAAVLLATLPEDAAAALLAKLAPPDFDVVSLAMAQAADAAPEEQCAVAAQFAAAKTLLINRRKPPFDFLRYVDRQRALALVRDERPQTIALILAHLPSPHAAEILSGMPHDQQQAIARRVAFMRPVDADILREVEQELAARMTAPSTKAA